MIPRLTRTALIGAAALVLALTTVADADDLKTVETEIIKAAQKVKSYSSDMNMKSEMTMPTGSMKNIGAGKFAAVRKGDAMLFRMELKTTMTTKQGENEQKIEQDILTISDGEFTYTLTEQFGTKMAFKNDLDPKAAGVASKEMFEDLEKEYDVKLLPEGSYDGQTTYVIEMTPKTANPMVSKMQMHFNKDHGMVMQILAFGPDGTPSQTITYDNMKINIDLKPDQFKFVAPEGVQIQDMSGA